MASGTTTVSTTDWRAELPVLGARLITLREPSAQDLGPLVDLLSIGDATRFGIGDPIAEIGVQEFIERVARDRRAGLAFTYAVTMSVSRAVVGLVQVRQLDPAFEAAEWDCTIVPSSRGTGIFVEAAR